MLMQSQCGLDFGHADWQGHRRPDEIDDQDDWPCSVADMQQIE